MADRGGVHFFLYEDCLIRVPTDDLVPKFGSLLLARHLPLQPDDVVLDLGTGAGLIGVLAARRGHRVVATDVVEAYAKCAGRMCSSTASATGSKCASGTSSTPWPTEPSI